VVLVLGVAPAAFAGAAGESSPEGVSFGLGVAPLRESLGVATVPGAVGGEGVRALEADPRGGVLSFDLKLAWPGVGSTSVVEPYLAVGPALIVVEPDYAGRLLGTRVDSTLRLGARAGAGLNWRVGKNATLFGAYELTTAGQGGLTSPGGRAPADTEASGYDLTYGLRFRY
jgi:opacity protein-like surface antigen